MRSKLLMFFFFLFGAALFFTACEESSTTDPGAVEHDFFPNKDGNYYLFNIDTLDSSGKGYAIGTRSTIFLGTQSLAGKTYQKQIDTLKLDFTEEGLSFFRKAADGVFYYLDTAGLYESIPDTLLQFIQMDSEVQFLSFPLTVGKSWSVFKLKLNYLLTFTLVDLTATYEADENVTLSLKSGTVTKQAAKIKYQMNLNIPDLENPLLTNTSQYTSYVWFVDNIGVIQMRGDASILNSFSGGGIDMEDTTKVVEQKLVDYNLK